MGECSQGVALDFSLDWMEADEMAVCPTCTDTSTSVRKNMSSINCSSDWQPQEGRTRFQRSAFTFTLLLLLCPNQHLLFFLFFISSQLPEI